MQLIHVPVTKRSVAFTLIELLITVSIITILAAIAVPNFLEAQTRAKVTRVKSDQRTLVTALESYATDYNAYPQSNFVPRFQRFLPLTTPVSYLSTIPNDPFNPPDAGSSGFRQTGDYRYGAMPLTTASRFALASDGPDQNNDTDPIRYYPGYSQELFAGGVTGFDYTLYDPTNGTISNGDVFRASDYNPG